MRKLSLLIFVYSCLIGTLQAGNPKVLYLGDSNSLTGFGPAVEAILRHDGVNVHAVVDRGAGPYHWLKEYQQFHCDSEYWEKSATTERHVYSKRTVPKIDGLLKEIRPDVVVVQAGSSLYGLLRSKRRSKEANVAEVRNLVALMSRTISEAGARPYWILPPHTHEKLHPAELQNELAGIISSIVEEGGGRTFDSKRVTHYNAPYPENDGVTYSLEDASEWASQVYPDLIRFIMGDRVTPQKPPALTKSQQNNPIPVNLTPFSDVSAITTQ